MAQKREAGAWPARSADAASSAAISTTPGNVLRRSLKTHSFNAQTVAKLHAALRANPGRVDAWMQLGDAHRRLGDFAAAGEAYRQALARQPDNRSAAWRRAIVAGEPLPPPAPDADPAPFLQLRNFLPPSETERLRQWTAASRGIFYRMPRWPEGNRINELYHRAHGAPLDAHPTVNAWFMPKVYAALPRVMAALRMHDLAKHRGRLHLGLMGDGGFSRPHRDACSLIGVFFHHKEPRSFSGGDVLLHDYGPETEEGALGFSRIEPIGNSIVFYPGGALHEIETVACDPDDFLTGRLTAVMTFWPAASEPSAANAGTGSAPASPERLAAPNMLD